MSRTSILFIAVACLLAQLLPCRAEFMFDEEPTTPSPGSVRCPQIKDNSATCACQHEHGKIDLTPLANTDGTARFTDLPGPTGDYNFNYNPCVPYKSELCKGDVFGCQVSSDGKNGYTVANANTEEMWIDEDGKVFVYYTAGPRMSIVSLFCDQKAVNTTITTTGDSIKELHYLFDITSCHVCPGGCSSGTSAGVGGIAGVIGIVIILLAIIAIVTYFVVGALIMAFHKQASGTDIIPNKEFWVQFPYLIKDGCVFTFGPPTRFIKEKIRGGQGYQKA